jgi:Carbohydrate binding domain
VTPALAQQIAAGPTGPGKCHTVDRFILCSPKTDFGLSPDLGNPAAQLQEAIADSGFEDGDLSTWPSWLNVKAAPSTSRAHSGRQSLAESAAAGSVYQDVTGLQPGSTYAVAAWMSGSSNATAKGQIALFDPGANRSIFSTPLDPGQQWQLVTDSVTVSASGTLRIHLFRNEGSGTIFWDDVRIYRER